MNRLFSLLRKYSGYLYLTVFACVLLIGFHEFQQFADYWEIRINISAEVFYLIAATTFLAFRFLIARKHIFIKTIFFDIALFVTILTLISASYLSLNDLVLSANAAFLRYHVLTEELLYFSLVLSSLLIISLPWSYLAQRAKYLLFFLPGLFYVVMLYIFVMDRALFTSVNAEDSVVEYSTSLLFLMSGLGLLKVQKETRNKLIKLFVILAAVGLIVIAGEEISWGQRLLGVETPDAIAEHNTQNELTLHNLNFIYYHIVPAYVLVGLVAGLLAPVGKALISRMASPKLQDLRFWLPGFVTSLFFLQLSLQRYFTREFPYRALSINNWDLVIWNEFSEAVAALGVFIFVCGLILQMRKRV